MRAATAAMLAGAVLAIGAVGAPGAGAGRCPTGDRTVDESSFAFLLAPAVGTPVRSGFRATGCSRTFESTVVWRLRGRTGRVLVRGTTMGGGADGAGPFAFTVRYSVKAAQVGRLEVEASDPSAGEGPPAVRNVIPLVLRP
jgi:Immunoglobulin-like domain of bacterial spore germination